MLVIGRMIKLMDMVKCTTKVDKCIKANGLMVKSKDKGFILMKTLSMMVNSKMTSKMDLESIRMHMEFMKALLEIVRRTNLE